MPLRCFRAGPRILIMVDRTPAVHCSWDITDANPIKYQISERPGILEMRTQLHPRLLRGSNESVWKYGAY
jgi:hypothetical protein